MGDSLLAIFDWFRIGGAAQITVEVLLFVAVLAAVPAWRQVQAGRPFRLNIRAGELIDAGAINASERVYRKAVRVGARTLGEADPNYLTLLGNLAGLLRDKGDHAEAEALYRRSLGRGDELEAGTPGLAARRHGLAVVLAETGRFDEAEPLFRQALATMEGSSAPADYLNWLRDFAARLAQAERWEDAERRFRDVIRLDAAIVGKTDPQYAADLDQLARVLARSGRLEDSEPFLREALGIVAQCCPPTDPAHSMVLGDLAFLLASSDRNAEAEALLRPMLANDAAAFAQNPREYASLLDCLSRVLCGTDRFVEAEALSRQACAIAAQAFGEDHLSHALCLVQLARVVEASGRLGEAEEIHRDLLADGEAAFGRSAPDFARRLVAFALFLARSGRVSEAAAFGLEALAILRGTVGEDHQETVAARKNLAELGIHGGAAGLN